MDKVKKALRIIVHGKLVVEGKGRTYVRVPIWLAVIALLSGRRAIRFGLLTALIVVAFGMEARVEEN